MAFLTRQPGDQLRQPRPQEMYRYDPAERNGSSASPACPTGRRRPPTSRASHDGLFMADDGRAFFSTNDALVPQDTNALIDVYEYVDGRPQLITTGTAAPTTRSGSRTQPSAGLVGVSGDGTDVYFSTFDTLVPQDHNGHSSSSTTPAPAAASPSTRRRRPAKPPTSATAPAARSRSAAGRQRRSTSAPAATSRTKRKKRRRRRRTSRRKAQAARPTPPPDHGGHAHG